jgi:two-component system CheB/CheR fusion protein
VHGLLTQVIEDVRPQAEAKQLALHLTGCRCSIRSDQGLLGRILGNLVANAVRHTPSGRILVGCRYRKDGVRIEVRDSGPGIPPEMHAAIFDEYVQLANAARLRDQGLGLGLSMVRRLAELLGHRVGLRSAPGRGSTFWIDVPLVSRDAVTPAAGTPGTARAAGALRRILYIEDDPDVREATSLILQIKGFEVHRAASGEEAYRTVSAEALQPDLILSDFRLPGNENGAQVVQRVRTLLERDVPVVFMTGDTSEARIRETRLSCCEVLRKPVDADKLSRALENAAAAPDAPGKTRDS